MCAVRVYMDYFVRHDIDLVILPTNPRIYLEACQKEVVGTSIQDARIITRIKI